MITAVDTSVLLDVFLPDESYGPASREWLRSAYDEGAIIVCDVVYAELVAAFADRGALDRALGEIRQCAKPVLVIRHGDGVRSRCSVDPVSSGRRLP